MDPAWAPPSGHPNRQGYVILYIHVFSKPCVLFVLLFYFYLQFHILCVCLDFRALEKELTKAPEERKKSLKVLHAIEALLEKAGESVA